MPTPVTPSRTVPVRTFLDIHEEGILNAAVSGNVYPGTIARNINGDVTLFDGTAAATAGAWGVLIEQEGLGESMTSPYVAEDRIRLAKMGRGDRFRAFLAQDTGATADYDAGTIFTPSNVGLPTPYTQAAQAGGMVPNGLLAKGTLAISATAAKYKTTTTAYFRIAGVQYSKSATDNLEFTAAQTINTGTDTGSFWGAWLLQIDAAGTTSTKAVSADQVYASKAAALAAVPAPDAGNVAYGYIVINANADVAWTANTDDMTDASDVLTAEFIDATAVAPTMNLSPVLFELVTTLPEDNIKSATLADRAVVLEVL